VKFGNGESFTELSNAERVREREREEVK